MYYPSYALVVRYVVRVSELEFEQEEKVMQDDSYEKSLEKCCDCEVFFEDGYCPECDMSWEESAEERRVAACEDRDAWKYEQ